MLPGYSYDYLSPDNFALPNAVVTNRILAETGPAYRALVIRGTDTLTLAGAKAVAAYANNGLTVIISGGIPTKIAAPTGLPAAQKKLQSILSLSNVYQVASGPLESAISNAGIMLLTTINANATCIHPGAKMPLPASPTSTVRIFWSKNLYFRPNHEQICRLPRDKCSFARLLMKLCLLSESSSEMQ